MFIFFCIDSFLHGPLAIHSQSEDDREPIDFGASPVDDASPVDEDDDHDDDEVIDFHAADVLSSTQLCDVVEEEEVVRKDVSVNHSEVVVQDDEYEGEAVGSGKLEVIEEDLVSKDDAVKDKEVCEKGNDCEGEVVGCREL